MEKHNTHHAAPNEIIDMETWAEDLPSERTKFICRTKEMELIRLVLPANESFSEHKVAGPITVHCTKGKIRFDAMGESKKITAGQLLYLMPGELHSLTAEEDAVVLLTIIFLP